MYLSNCSYCYHNACHDDVDIRSNNTDNILDCITICWRIVTNIDKETWLKEHLKQY